MVYRNLFATVVTFPAPSSNYRGEASSNLSPIQTISIGGEQRAVMSGETLRNEKRKTLASYGLPCNRSRVFDAGQPAVHFESCPDPDKYCDDFIFGWLMAVKEAKEKELRNEGKLKHPLRRDSIFRVNMAVALNPFMNDTLLHQSPVHDKESPWQNSAKSALLLHQVSFTAFQYPFALLYSDCRAKKEWIKALLRAISEANGAAGNHARSYFDMSPASIVARLTPRLAAGYEMYGFTAPGSFPSISRLNESDLPADEFWIGGEVVRQMNPDEVARLKSLGANLFASPDRLMDSLSENFLGQG